MLLVRVLDQGPNGSNGQRALYTRIPFIMDNGGIIAGGGGGGGGGKLLSPIHSATGYPCQKGHTCYRDQTVKTSSMEVEVAVEQDILTPMVVAVEQVVVMVVQEVTTLVVAVAVLLTILGPGTSHRGGDGGNLGQNGQNGFGGGGNAGTAGTAINGWSERQGSAGSGYAQNNIRGPKTN